MQSTDQEARVNEFVQHTDKIQGELIEEDFERLKELGVGHQTNGVVWKVRHKPTELIMAKKLILQEIKPALQKQIMCEITLLHEYNCPYIVGYYGVTFGTNEMSMYMEYMDGGSLDILLAKAHHIPENALQTIAYALLKGLSYLWEKHTNVSRTVCPRHVLVNSRGHIKLSDVGVSGLVPMKNRFRKQDQPRCYLSPERLKGCPYSARSDSWSLGLSLVELAQGRYPIPAAKSSVDTGNKISNIYELLDCIVEEEPPKLSENHFSPLFCDFANRSLKKDPNERAGLTELISHPWVMEMEAENDNKDFAAFVSGII